MIRLRPRVNSCHLGPAGGGRTRGTWSRRCVGWSRRSRTPPRGAPRGCAARRAGGRRRHHRRPRRRAGAADRRRHAGDGRPAQTGRVLRPGGERLHEAPARGSARSVWSTIASETTASAAPSPTCILRDGTFANAEIVRRGYGHAYTRFPFRHLERFRRLEREAREAGRGLWGAEAANERPARRAGSARDASARSPSPARRAVPWDDNGNGRVSCAEARRHGIAPVPRGHPAYPYMNDRDGDGVVCE